MVAFSCSITQCRNSLRILVYHERSKLPAVGNTAYFFRPFHELLNTFVLTLESICCDGPTGVTNGRGSGELQIVDRGRGSRNRTRLQSQKRSRASARCTTGEAYSSRRRRGRRGATGKIHSRYRKKRRHMPATNHGFAEVLQAGRQMRNPVGCLTCISSVLSVGALMLSMRSKGGSVLPEQTRESTRRSVPLFVTARLFALCWVRSSGLHLQNPSPLRKMFKCVEMELAKKREQEELGIT
jgi:hypothetical protein